MNTIALPFERLDVNNSVCVFSIFNTNFLIPEQVLLIVDQQVGMTTFVRDFDSTGFYRSMLAHASIGNLFNIPVILTSIAQNGNFILHENNASLATANCSRCQRAASTGDYRHVSRHFGY